MIDTFTLTPDGLAKLAEMGIDITDADLRRAGWTPSIETPCPNADWGNQHCCHWYDGAPCCACGDGPMPIGEMIQNGMLNREDYL